MVRCFVCGESYAEFKYTIELGVHSKKICSDYCHRVYCSEYQTAKLEVDVQEMEDRLKSYKNKEVMKKK